MSALSKILGGAPLGTKMPYEPTPTKGERAAEEAVKRDVAEMRKRPGQRAGRTWPLESFDPWE